MEVGLVLGIGRRKTHAKLARRELNESLDHFMRAATHAAGGMGAAVGPKVNAARDYVNPTAGRMRNAASQGWESALAAFAPLASAAKDGARSAGDMALRTRSRNKKREAEMGRKRRSAWAGMLAAGAAVGAAGALIMRRRKQRWEEYDPAQALEAMRDDADTMIDSTQKSVDRAADAGASAAGKASGTMAESTEGQASSAAATVKDRASSAAETAKRQKDQATDQAEDLISKSPPSRNTRS
ncbi:MAG TPA: hypothetical protein VGJ53_18685 [Micromonosporaceae bacterium]